ncbi:hypothetical protein LCGC14_2254020 [marine sediment metagenome]|uniref:DUF4242 domain-containing protein n=1 Tax=marine sediment metagenome TaxID=412755 RepID=A0A0F9D1H8_9ZZZZ
MQLYMIRRRSAWADKAELEKTAAISGRIGEDEMSDRLRWIRSYVVNEADGRLGTCCLYEAADSDAIRDHARRVGMPGDDVLPVAATVVVRPDPDEA